MVWSLMIRQEADQDVVHVKQLGARGTQDTKDQESSVCGCWGELSNNWHFVWHTSYSQPLRLSLLAWTDMFG